MPKKETIRISFEITPHEAALTRHWIAKQRISSYPTGSIAKTMYVFMSALEREVDLYKEKKDG